MKKMIGPITTIIALIALATFPAAPGSAQTGGTLQPGASAPTGAKALFYGSSGATIQSNAPGPGMSMGRPAPPASSLGTGFPSAPGMAAVQQDYMGVSYWIDLLEPSGQLRRVTVDHAFRAGDRIRLKVQTNRDGYLTVLNVGSTGRVTTIFPLTADAATAQIRASQVYQIPPGAFLRFDANPGEETILLLLSPTPLAGTTIASAPPGGALPGAATPGGGVMPGAAPPGGLPPLPPPAGVPGTGVAGAGPMPQPGSPPMPGAPAPAGAPAFPPPSQGGDVPLPFPGAEGSTATATPPPGSPGGPSLPSPAGSDVAGAPVPASAEGAKAALVRRAMQWGAKDLVVEVDSASPQPASYAVAPVTSLRDGGMISLQIKLRHY